LQNALFRGPFNDPKDGGIWTKDGGRKRKTAADGRKMEKDVETQLKMAKEDTAYQGLAIIAGKRQ